MLELDGLHKRFGDVVALDGCSFSVEPGHVLGFLGRNGAGKTTAMRSIFGLLQLDAGEVRWRGRTVDREARFGFGYMPEERGLYPRMELLDQLVYFARLRRLDRHAARRSAAHWLERLGLADRADSAVESLSHGNQQKAQLAVSLIGEPDLLVLDEPFSGLDPIAADVLISVIREAAAAGAAVVFSSHQLDIVGDVCDEVSIITHGKSVLTGNLARIRRESPVRTLALALSGPAQDGWPERLAAAVPGASIVQRNGNHAVFSVGSEVRPQDVLAALDGQGVVEAFRLEPPDLDEIFRRAAGEPI